MHEKKYIDVDALKAILLYNADTGGMLVKDLRTIFKVADEMPAEFSVQIAHARWKLISSADDGYCSRCGFAILGSQSGEAPLFAENFGMRKDPNIFPGIITAAHLLNYCPNCGAKMDEEE